MPRSRAARRLFLLVPMLCGAAEPALAQRTIDDPEYVITNWQTEDGLPENSATAIVQTPDGYLWFGTFNGLVRFDGVAFTVLDSRNTPELPSPGIVNLHLDRAGRLWVSTVAGVACMKDGRWRVFGAGSGWVGDYVRWFVEAPDGRLYMATFDGKLLQFRDDHFEKLPDPRPGPTHGYFAYLDEEEHLCVLQTGYAGTWLNGAWQRHDLSGPIVLGERDGWFRARDGTLVHVGDRTLRRLTGGKVLSRTLQAGVAGFWSMTEDSRGSLWFSSFSHGLFRIAPDGRMRHFSTASGFPADNARGVFEDRQGDLWVGTSGGGLLRLRPRRFTSYGREHGLPASDFRSVTIGRDGVVSVATYVYGLFRLRDGVAARVRVPAEMRLPQCVLVDHDGRLWVGTFGAGVYVLEKGRWTRLARSLPSIETLFEDSRGRVWAGLSAAALVWNGPRGEPRRVPLSTSRGGIRCFAEDAAGAALWAGAASGLYRLVGERLEQVPGPERLTSFDVTSLLADGDGRLWVGTASSGLWLRSGDRWVDVGERTGFPASTVSGLREVGGFLWVATSRGIWRTQKARLVAALSEGGREVVWQSFGLGDGMPSVDCSYTSQPSIASDAAGRLWFCTLKGLAVVDPARLESGSDDMPVYIERLDYVDGGSRRHEATGSELQRLSVPAGSRDCGIVFTAIDLSAPEKVLFSSELQRNGQPVSARVSERREARYPALEPGEYRLSVRARDGDGVWSRNQAQVRFTLQPFFWETLRFRLLLGLVAGVAIAAITRQLTLARARRARQLSELQARLALVLQNTNDAVFFTAPDERVTYMNEAAARLLGLPGTEAAASLRAADLYPPWAYELVTGAGMEAVRAQGSWQGYAAFRHEDGHEVPIWQLLVGHREPGGALDFVSSIARDMTELKRMEEQVRQAQKMESVGLLAGGVAHDFNNLLQVIQASTALAQRPTLSAADRDAHLRNVVEAADRAAILTRQLLAFGRRQPLKMEDTDLSELVSNHLRMIRRVIGEHITVHLVVGRHLGNVRCDRAQVEQVLLNLCVNARDAMPSGGQLTIALEDTWIDPGFAAVNEWARPGRYVLLSVADTGVGMDAATRERIFEPFFSTKATGTGLGLSVVYGIIRQHGGMVHVYSEPGRGTTFKAYLPSVERSVVEEQLGGEKDAPGGRETILVAEDDAAVARVTRQILEGAGYTVLFAEDGAAAVRLFEEHADEVDLLVLDVVMPVLGGRGAVAEIHRRRPAIPVLFCSGYAPLAREPDASAGPEVPDPFLQKPYSPGELLRRVRAILDARRS